MRRAGIFVAALCATFLLSVVSLSTPVDATAAWWNANWQYRRAITIDENKIDANLDNFPVTVFLSASNFDFSKVSFENGQDIRFTDSSGAELAYEIENFSKTGQVGIIHVKIPSVSGTENTVFWIYYGNPSAGNGQNPTAVWDSNYKMVQHMKDATTSTTLDSTANGYNGSKTGANEPQQVDAKIGKGQSFDGSNDKIAISGNPIGVNYNDPFTMELWMKTNSATTFQWLFGKYHGINPPGYYGWFLAVNETGKFIFVSDKSQLAETDIYSDSTISAGTWYHVAITLDSSRTMKMFVNGVQQAQTGTGRDGSPNSYNTNIGYNQVENNFYFNGVIDEVRASYGARSTAWIKATYNSLNNTLLVVGAEETCGVSPNKVIIENITVDRYLVDRDNDWGATNTAITVSAVVYDNAGRDAILNENVKLKLVDNSGTERLALTAFTSYENVDNYRKRFYYTFDPSDSLPDSALGTWDAYVWAKDNSTAENSAWSYEAFYVDDIYLSASVENIPGHVTHIYGSAYRIKAGTRPDNVEVVDTVRGTWSVDNWSGVNYSQYFSPSSGAQFYVRAKSENIDGKSSTATYAFPNFAPTIISTSSSQLLVDRKQDYPGSGAVTQTRLTAVFDDPDGYVDFAAARIGVRDAADVVVENASVFTTATFENGTRTRMVVYLDYNPADNQGNLGAFDVWRYAADNWSSVSGWANSVFTVDDLTSTVSVSPARPYVGWSVTVSGTHSRVSGGAISVSGSWLADNVHGTFSLGASASYSQTYTVSKAGLSENVGLLVRVVANGALDGVTQSSYLTNENARYEITVRYEDNYGLWAVENDRLMKIMFEWDGGTYTYTMTANPENINVPSSGATPKIVKLTDSNTVQNYWRYVIPDLPGGQLTFVISANPAAVSMYRFFLQDFTGLYKPPNGQMLIKLWIGTTLTTINADYWGADWRMTAWLMDGTQYQVWVRGSGTSAPLRLVGPIDAVAPSEEKTIVVQVVSEPLDSIFNHVYWSAWRENSVIRAEYRDNLDNTIAASVSITTGHGDLVGYYQPDNSWFIITYAGAEEGESYSVTLSVTHGTYGEFTATIPVGYMAPAPEIPGGVSETLGFPAGLTLAAIGSIILAFVVALGFDATRAHFGVLGMVLVILAMWYLKLLPLPGPFGGAFTAVLLLVAAVLFAITWGRRR